MSQIRLSMPDLWHEFGRAQDEFLRIFGRHNNGPHRNFTATGPAVNVWEDEKSVFAECDLPGILIDKLDVTVTEGDQLTIQGERQLAAADGAVWHRQERAFGQFVRQVKLPAIVDADKVAAKYEHGVLRLTMPKHVAALPRKILVQAQN